MTVAAPPPRISVVIPIRNERDNVEPVLAELQRTLAGLSYEVVFVDDASTDGSRELLERLRDDATRVVGLRRKSGQSAAVCAGIDAARGDIIVTMDGDGQIDPSPMPHMINRVAAGMCDGVAGVRRQRASGTRRRWQSAIGNGVRDVITGDRVVDSACSLRVARRAVWDRLPRFNGMHRFFPTLARHSGASLETIDITERPRRAGRSHYGALGRAVVGIRDAIRVRRWIAREKGPLS